MKEFPHDCALAEVESIAEILAAGSFAFSTFTPSKPLRERTRNTKRVVSLVVAESRKRREAEELKTREIARLAQLQEQRNGNAGGLVAEKYPPARMVFRDAFSAYADR